MTARAFTEEELRHYGLGAKASATVWRYVLPHNQQSDGGTFLLDSSGMFAAQSAYGGYAYRWGAFGTQDFRAFFVRCDSSYLYGKLHQSPRGMVERLSDEETRANIRRAIWDQYGRYSPDRRREELDILRSIGDFGDRSAWDDWLRYTKIDEPWLCGVAAHEDPECSAFCNLLVPRLQARLRFDLARGKP